jgi:hypothetical protein
VVGDPIEPRRIRALVISEVISNSLKKLVMEWPKPAVDLVEIAGEWHAAAKAGSLTVTGRIRLRQRRVQTG